MSQVILLFSLTVIRYVGVKTMVTPHSGVVFDLTVLIGFNFVRLGEVSLAYLVLPYPTLP
jgi:hypothetical protein